MQGVVLPGDSTVAFREQPIPTPGQGRIVVEQVPLSPKLDNRMVRRPTNDRFQNPPPVGERPERVVARGIDQVVRVAGGVEK